MRPCLPGITYIWAGRLYTAGKRSSARRRSSAQKATRLRRPSAWQRQHTNGPAHLLHPALRLGLGWLGYVTRHWGISDVIQVDVRWEVKLFGFEFVSVEGGLVGHSQRGGGASGAEGAGARHGSPAENPLVRATRGHARNSAGGAHRQHGGRTGGAVDGPCAQRQVGTGPK